MTVSVTGLTADKMQAIATQFENEQIESAAIDPDTGHLVLTKHDGSTVDAGQAAGNPKSAALNEDGHLIFTAYDGTETDLGSLVGPTGPTGPAGGVPVDLESKTQNVDLLLAPGAYYIASGSTNLPLNASVGAGVMEIFKQGDNILIQRYIDESGYSAIRTSTDAGTTWGAWTGDQQVLYSDLYTRSFLFGGM